MISKNKCDLIVWRDDSKQFLIIFGELELLVSIFFGVKELFQLQLDRSQRSDPAPKYMGFVFIENTFVKLVPIDESPASVRQTALKLPIIEQISSFWSESTHPIRKKFAGIVRNYLAQVCTFKPVNI